MGQGTCKTATTLFIWIKNHHNFTRFLMILDLIQFGRYLEVVLSLAKDNMCPTSGTS